MLYNPEFRCHPKTEHLKKFDSLSILEYSTCQVFGSPLYSTVGAQIPNVFSIWMSGYRSNGQWFRFRNSNAGPFKN